MRRIILVLSILLLVSGCQGQEVTVPEDQVEQGLAISYLDDEELYAHMEVLTSPELTGRLSGTQGFEKASDYVENYLRALGFEIMEQNFQVPVVLDEGYHEFSIYNEGGHLVYELSPFQEYLPYHFLSTGDINESYQGTITLISGQDKISSELKGKFVLVEEKNISPQDRNRIVEKLAAVRAKGVLLHREEAKRNEYFLKSAYISPELEQTGFRDENGLMTYYINETAYDKLLEAASKSYEVKVTMDFSFEEVETTNLIAYWPGTGENLLLLGAHLDHVGTHGQNLYFPGALDNASGVSLLLEVAQVVAKSSEQPKESLAFIFFSGEEEQIAGSAYYVDNPLFPLEETRMINLDMVGSDEGLPLTIAYAGYTNELVASFESLADKRNLTYLVSMETMSDHGPFSRAGVPAVMLHHGDMDDIHTPADTVEGNFDVYAALQVGRLLLEFIEDTAY